MSVMTDHPMSQTEYEAFGQGQMELWIRIRTEYRDVFRWFKRKRYAEFGWRYTNVGLRILSKYQDSN